MSYSFTFRNVAAALLLSVSLMGCGAAMPEDASENAADGGAAEKASSAQTVGNRQHGTVQPLEERPCPPGTTGNSDGCSGNGGGGKVHLAD